MARKLGLSDWAHIAEIIGGVAIIASLVFVGIELRETNEQLMLSSDANADFSNISLTVRIAENPELSELVFRAERQPGSLTELEMWRFENIALPRLAIWENTFDGYQAGNMDEESWLAWDRFFRLRWGLPGYKVVYENFRVGFGPNSDGYFEDVFGLPPKAKE